MFPSENSMRRQILIASDWLGSPEQEDNIPFDFSLFHTSTA
jgi:hypothetical protein